MPLEIMLRELLESLESNPIFSGGLTLMIIGSAAALLRKLPVQLWAFVERRLSIPSRLSIVIPPFAGFRPGWPRNPMPIGHAI